MIQITERKKENFKFSYERAKFWEEENGFGTRNTTYSVAKKKLFSIVCYIFM